MTPCCWCLGVYSHFPWSVSLHLFMITACSLYRNNCTVTRRAESLSLLQPIAPLFSCLFFLYKKTGVTATCGLVYTLVGGVGREVGGREQGRAVKCYRNSWLKRGNDRYATSSIDTEWVGVRLSQQQQSGLCSHSSAITAFHVKKQLTYGENVQLA